MTQHKIKTTRQELYDKVWSTPMRKLAQEFGLSDVGLAKVCKRQNIPRPGLGYWAKLEHGKPTKKIPLPKAKGGASEEVFISIMETNTENIEPEELTEAELLMRKIKSEGIVPIDMTLSNPHPYIEKTHKHLKNAKKTRSRLLAPAAIQCLSINVGPESLQRALAVMDSVIKSMAKYGMGVALPEEKDTNTIVTVFGQNLGIKLEEGLLATEKELNQRQKKEKEKYPWRYRNTEYDYSPNGKLAIRLTIEEYVVGIRKQWADGSKQRVEDCIQNLLVGIVKAAVAAKAWRLEIEERDRRWEEQRRLEAERRKQEQEEKQRIENLSQQLHNWQKSKEVKAYLEATEQFIRDEYGGWEEASEFGQWLQWAYGYAERINPLKKNQ